MTRPAIVFTMAALVAFAGNSILCRMALGRAAIDAATFSTIRLAAGAVMLFAVTAVTQPGGFRLIGSWTSAIWLFLYAVPFSFAYLSLSAGTGALILFGSVQMTMMAAALVTGERPHTLQWVGLVGALGGLVYLVRPGLTAPAPAGSVLMALSGMSWAFYSLRGRGASSPLALTASNFLRALPFAALVSLIVWSRGHVTREGAMLAILSGAITSGLGYVLWYGALRSLTATRAAVVQLPTPILTAIGGVMVLGETISPRLLVSAAVVLGGIALALAGRERTDPRALASADDVLAFRR